MFLYLVHLLFSHRLQLCLLQWMKVQFHKSQYSTVGRSSCLVRVFNMYVCEWMGGGGMGGGDLMPSSPVICINTFTGEYV